MRGSFIELVSERHCQWVKGSEEGVWLRQHPLVFLDASGRAWRRWEYHDPSVEARGAPTREAAQPISLELFGHYLSEALALMRAAASLFGRDYRQETFVCGAVPLGNDRVEDVGGAAISMRAGGCAKGNQELVTGVGDLGQVRDFIWDTHFSGRLAVLISKDLFPEHDAGEGVMAEADEPIILPFRRAA